MWFARRGYMVVAPSGSGYGAAALDEPERGLVLAVLFKDRQLRQSELPRCRTCGGPYRQVDHRIHGRSKADRAGQRHCGRPVRRRLGRHRAVEPRTCRGYARSSHSRRAVADASAANPTTIARPTDWLRRPVNSGAPRASRCCGSTSRTTRSSARNYRGECTRLTPRLAETPNITCFLRSATTGISWSVRPTAFRCGRRWSGRSWTSTDQSDAGMNDGGER